LARIPDARAEQFWDPDHLIAEELHQAVASSGNLPKEKCCVSHGHFWDMAAIFPADTRAVGALPAPIFFDGEVVGQESAIRAKLKELLSPQIPSAKP
jgi:hypothetical protein